MKKLIVTTAVLFFSILSFAQTRSTELFDLVSSLTLPKNSTAGIISWKSLAQLNPTIKWKDKVPVKMGTGFQQKGVASALIEGKKFVCEDQNAGKKAECKWDFSFLGKTAGYDQFGFSAINFPVYEPGSEIKMLFPKNASSFKLLSKCIEGASYWVNLYEVNIPGKKTFWMLSTYESMSATASQYESSGIMNSFYVGFYFSRKMAEDNCTN